MNKQQFLNKANQTIQTLISQGIALGWSDEAIKTYLRICAG